MVENWTASVFNVHGVNLEICGQTDGDFMPPSCPVRFNTVTRDLVIHSQIIPSLVQHQA